MKKPKAKPTKKPSSTRPEWADSITEASRITGIPRRTLSNYKRAGCLAFRDNGKVHLAELQDWMEINGREAGPAPPELVAARIAYLAEQTRRVKRENDVKGKLVRPVPEILAGIDKLAAFFWFALDRLLRHELPPSLAGLDAMAIARVLKERLLEIQAEMRLKIEQLKNGEIIQ